MAVPKRKTSKTKKRQRKASHRHAVPATCEDKQGGGDHLPHRVSPTTGMYRGRQVLTISTDE